MPADKYEGLNQWFSTFLVERNPNETFQRLEEPLCGNLIDLCQGGPTSALLWATFQNYSSHNQLKTPIFVPKSGCTLKKKGLHLEAVSEIPIFVPKSGCSLKKKKKKVFTWNRFLKLLIQTVKNYIYSRKKFNEKLDPNVSCKTL